MSPELNLHQSAKLSQQLGLAPQLLQWLRLLQVPTTDLATLVQHELETNPVLEVNEHDAPSEEEDTMDQEATVEPEEPVDREDDNGLDVADEDMNDKFEALAEIDGEWREEFRAGGHGTRSSDANETEKHQFVMDSIACKCSLQEHLEKQLAACDLTRAEYEQAELIIGSLDDRGYLAAPLSELAAIHGAPVESLERVLLHVQTLDPAGVGARDLRECLLLQMVGVDPREALPARLVRDHFDLLASGHVSGMALSLGVAEDEIHEALSYIAGLQPEPGRKFSAESIQYITSDVTVRRVEGEYVVELNDEFIPRLRLSSSCHRLIQDGKAISSSDMAYVRRKMRNASFLIQGIAQRQETLRKVAGEIARVQRAFLDDEKGELVPLTMGRVARIIGVHETTVSRALANKYIQTPRGLLEMKSFFKAGYACADGSALTPEKVKQTIADMVNREDPLKPLTDLQMVQVFQTRGLTVARRTIAKYREELDIDSSKVRKKSGPPVLRIAPSVPLPLPVMLPRPAPTEEERSADWAVAK